MIEPIMYFGIGFLFASLIGLVLIPLVHNRAVRLTMRRIEASTPVSMTEIQADKDQLRAEFAMSMRRLEMSVDQLKARTTTQLAEIGKKTEAINRLKGELGEKSAAIFALESREKSLRDRIGALEEELAAKTGAIAEAGRGLADREAALAKLTSELGDQTFASDSQRIEIIALRTQVGALKSQIERFEADVKAAEAHLGRVRVEADNATAELSAERGKAADLATRLAQLERQLLAQTTESEVLSRRVHELEARLSDQGRLLAEREQEAAALREERDALQRELAAKRDPDVISAAERVENALLRERINDIATEVARLTLALEGPGSPIEEILAKDRGQSAGVNGNAAAHGENDAINGGNLADRIRALQVRAARVAQAS